MWMQTRKSSAFRRRFVHDLRPRPHAEGRVRPGPAQLQQHGRGQALWVEDDLTRRYATLDDVRTAARLADGLPAINIVGAMADPHELPVEYRCVVVAAEQIKHTTKPITFWFHDRASARFLIELFADRGRQRGGGRPPAAGLPVPGADQPAAVSPSTASTCCSRRAG